MQKVVKRPEDGVPENGEARGGVERTSNARKRGLTLTLRTGGALPACGPRICKISLLATSF